MEDIHLGGQEDGIAMKGAQSKVKWGAQGVTIVIFSRLSYFYPLLYLLLIYINNYYC